ncbi:hypothetical protein TWF694_008472 [Orbilia ellipsospora]|uniref:Mis18 domain-containing protein n=1 Tax=Orbilia ellipsospora TaxID=2528407 RepID=A0AAV9XG94_9PEZI
MPPKPDTVSTQHGGSSNIQPPILLDRPFTVSCKHCRTILGDSSAAECSIEALKVIVLSHGTNLAISETAKTPKKGGEDEVSIYHVIKCEDCKHSIGRKYVAIPKYPQIQEKVSLFTSQTNIYYHGVPAPTNDGTENDRNYDVGDESLIELEPTQSDMIQDITQLKRFCLLLSDGQDNLAAQVAQQQQNKSNTTSEMRDLQIRLASLEDSLKIVIANQDKLMAQMKLQSKRSYSDFAVEIPVFRRQRSSSPKPAAADNNQNQSKLQQQHMSPPPSMLSEDRASDTNSTDDILENKHVSSSTADYMKSKTQPRQADSSCTDSNPDSRKTASNRKEITPTNTPIVISDGDENRGDGDNDPDTHSEKKVKRVKRASLAKHARSYRGRGGRASTGSVVLHELRIEMDRDERSSDGGSVGRVTRSKKST